MEKNKQCLRDIKCTYGGHTAVSEWQELKPSLLVFKELALPPFELLMNPFHIHFCM